MEGRVRRKEDNYRRIVDYMNGLVAGRHIAVDIGGLPRPGVMYPVPQEPVLLGVVEGDVGYPGSIGILLPAPWRTSYSSGCRKWEGAMGTVNQYSILSSTHTTDQQELVLPAQSLVSEVQPRSTARCHCS